MSSRRPWAVIAGGGTGGHVYPAIAVGEALVAAGHAPDDIRFVGSARGIEARLVPAAGFEVTLLPGRGIVRRFTWKNVRAIAGLVVAIFRALSLLARWRPAVVVSVGGYASVPCVVGAVLCRIPVVVVNIDAVPGAANRLAGKFCAAAAVAYEGTALPRSVLTGVPVRAEMAAVIPEARVEARNALELPQDARVILVSGGSLGARRLNEATLELVELWSQRSDIAIRHVTGKRDWDLMVTKKPSVEGLIYQQVPFEDRMPLLYAAADVAVQRAGASTVAELAFGGVPSILVPLPKSPGGHQEANARALQREGAAVVVTDEELSGKKLADELETLMSDPSLLERMSASAKKLARPDAAERIAKLVEEKARD